MLQEKQLAQCSSKISTRGDLWHSSVASFDHQNKSTVHSTASYWLLTWLFDTFVTSWKVARLLSTQTTSRWFVPRQQRQLAYISEFTTTDITSDRGSQFTSELWSALTRLYGTHIHWTSAYHPQANGMVERFHRHLKSALMARLTAPNWIDELPWVLLGIRTAPKEDLECSSAELVYGAPLTVPGDFLPCSQESQDAGRFLPRLHETVWGLAPRPPVPHGTRPSSVPATLATSEYVFIRRDCHRPPLTSVRGAIQGPGSWG